MSFGRGWLKAVMADSDLSDRAKAVAWAIEDHRNNETGLCYPGVDTLAEATGRSVSSVKRGIRELQEAGWIAKSDGRGRGNYTHYRLLSKGAVLTIPPAGKGVRSEPKKGVRSEPKKGVRSELSSSEKGSELTGKGVRSELSNNKAEPPNEPKSARELPASAERPAPHLRVFVERGSEEHERFDAWARNLGLLPLDALPALAVEGGFDLTHRRAPSEDDGTDAMILKRLWAWAQAAIVEIGGRASA